jgi:hypothetical protein
MRKIIIGLVVGGAFVVGIVVLALHLQAINTTRKKLEDYVTIRPDELRLPLEKEVYGSQEKGTYGGVLLTANRFGLVVWGQG